MTTPPVGQLGAVSIDCPEPASLAAFYRELLGMTTLVEQPSGQVVAITDGSRVAGADRSRRASLLSHNGGWLSFP